MPSRAASTAASQRSTDKTPPACLRAGHRGAFLARQGGEAYPSRATEGTNNMRSLHLVTGISIFSGLVIAVGIGCSSSSSKAPGNTATDTDTDGGGGDKSWGF